MIVRDLGDEWQVVLQTDHADLSAEFARAWAQPLSPSLVVVSERHDDGWAVWEQAPRIDAEGQPVTFFNVNVGSHLAFYRAAIAAVSEQDERAGVLLSMHGAGIYRQRYGLDTMMRLTQEEAVDEFVAEQEAKYGGEPSGKDREEYELLQLFDRLSLYFCMREPAADAAELQGYTIEPVGAWRIRITPFPFREQPSTFHLLRRVLPKRPWSEEEFRTELFATAPERLTITIE